MSEMEEKLNSILSNPQMMQQILTMAQSLGGGAKPEADVQKPPEHAAPPLPDLDPKMLQGLMGLARSNGVDRNQQALLHALSPYLSRDRVGKLERAMRAARMAGAASAFLGAGGIRLLSGR